MQARRFPQNLKLLAASLLLVLTGCQTSPPVQEMSDARQAITVAKEAGAGDTAAAALNSAIEFLESAEQSLSARDYARARRDAILAKDKALEALKISETAKAPESD